MILLLLIYDASELDFDIKSLKTDDKDISFIRSLVQSTDRL